MAALLDSEEFDDLAALLIHGPQPLQPDRLRHPRLRDVVRAINNAHVVETFAHEAQTRLDNRRPELAAALEGLLEQAGRLRADIDARKGVAESYACLVADLAAIVGSRDILEICFYSANEEVGNA